MSQRSVLDEKSTASDVHTVQVGQRQPVPNNTRSQPQQGVNRSVHNNTGYHPQQGVHNNVNRSTPLSNGPGLRNNNNTNRSTPLSSGPGFNNNNNINRSSPMSNNPVSNTNINTNRSTPLTNNHVSNINININKSTPLTNNPMNRTPLPTIHTGANPTPGVDMTTHNDPIETIPGHASSDPIIENNRNPLTSGQNGQNGTNIPPVVSSDPIINATNNTTVQQTAHRGHVQRQRVVPHRPHQQQGGAFQQQNDINNNMDRAFHQIFTNGLISTSTTDLVSNPFTLDSSDNNNNTDMMSEIRSIAESPPAPPSITPEQFRQMYGVAPSVKNENNDINRNGDNNVNNNNNNEMSDKSIRFNNSPNTPEKHSTLANIITPTNLITTNSLVINPDHYQNTNNTNNIDTNMSNHNNLTYFMSNNQTYHFSPNMDETNSIANYDIDIDGLSSQLGSIDLNGTRQQKQLFNNTLSSLQHHQRHQHHYQHHHQHQDVVYPSQQQQIDAIQEDQQDEQNQNNQHNNQQNQNNQHNNQQNQNNQHDNQQNLPNNDQTITITNIIPANLNFEVLPAFDPPPPLDDSTQTESPLLYPLLFYSTPHLIYRLFVLYHQLNQWGQLFGDTKPTSRHSSTSMIQIPRRAAMRAGGVEGDEEEEQVGNQFIEMSELAKAYDYLLMQYLTIYMLLMYSPPDNLEIDGYLDKINEGDVDIATIEGINLPVFDPYEYHQNDQNNQNVPKNIIPNNNQNQYIHSSTPLATFLHHHVTNGYKSPLQFGGLASQLSPIECVARFGHTHSNILSTMLKRAFGVGFTDENHNNNHRMTFGIDDYHEVASSNRGEVFDFISRITFLNPHGFTHTEIVDINEFRNRWTMRREVVKKMKMRMAIKGSVTNFGYLLFISKVWVHNRLPHVPSTNTRFEHGTEYLGGVDPTWVSNGVDMNTHPPQLLFPDEPLLDEDDRTDSKPVYGGSLDNYVFITRGQKVKTGDYLLINDYTNDIEESYDQVERVYPFIMTYDEAILNHYLNCLEIISNYNHRVRDYPNNGIDILHDNYDLAMLLKDRLTFQVLFAPLINQELYQQVITMALSLPSIPIDNNNQSDNNNPDDNMNDIVDTSEVLSIFSSENMNNNNIIPIITNSMNDINNNNVNNNWKLCDQMSIADSTQEVQLGDVSGDRGCAPINMALYFNTMNNPNNDNSTINNNTNNIRYRPDTFDTNSIASIGIEHLDKKQKFLIKHQQDKK